MFTGIVEETGVVKSIRTTGQAMRIHISCQQVLENTNLGDSISVNGVCLTADEMDQQSFTADVMPETYRRTNLKNLKSGSEVNLERAVPVVGRLGGHIVSGHVDVVGKLSGIRKEANAIWLEIQVPREWTRYVVEKGSVALDGVSLTVASVSEDWFAVSMIPHTVEETTLAHRQAGDEINIECDVIAKYVEKLLCYRDENQQQKMTLEWLQKNDF